jgi:hypothetical protein
MKTIVLLICFLFYFGEIFSQDLEGEWKGYFTENTYTNPGPKTTISIYFRKINDTVFQAFSKTVLKENKAVDSSVCVMRGGFLKKNVLYLEETKAIQSFAADIELCLQIMKLYYNKRKKQLQLSGDWYTDKENCGHGNIYLIKSNK